MQASGLFGAVGEADFAEPFAVGDGHAVGAEMELGLEVEGKELGALGFDD